MIYSTKYENEHTRTDLPAKKRLHVHRQTKSGMHRTERFWIAYKSYEVYCYAINLNEMFHECKHICIVFFCIFHSSGAFFFNFTMTGEKTLAERNVVVKARMNVFKGNVSLLIPIRNNYLVNSTWFISVCR